MNAIERIDALAKIKDLFPEMSSEHAMQVVDWATTRPTVLEPRRLDAAVKEYQSRHRVASYREAYAHVGQAVTAYLTAEVDVDLAA